MQRSTKILISVLTAFVCVQLFALSASAGQYIVKGVVTDKNSGKPTGATIEFRSPDGKKIKTQSNSATGEYQQVLETSVQYDVIFSGADVARQIEKLPAATSEQFHETIQNFSVRKMFPGMQFDKFAAFTSSSSSLGSEATKSLEELQEVLKFNRNIVFELRVNAHDKFKLQRKDPVKPAPEKKTKKDKKSKKGKKQDEPAPEAAPVEQPENASDSPKTHNTVDERVATMKKYVNSWTRFSERVIVVPDYSLGTPAGTESVVVVVKSIENSTN